MGHFRKIRGRFFQPLHGWKDEEILPVNRYGCYNDFWTAKSSCIACDFRALPPRMDISAPPRSWLSNMRSVKKQRWVVFP
jgi:hypothetical protein